MVMLNKEKVAEVALSDLEAVQNEWGLMDDEEDDLGFNPEGEATIAYYKMTLPEEQTAPGSYEVYVPAGTFILGTDTLASAAIFTYTIAGEPAQIAVTPAEGTVTELKEFIFTYGDSQAIATSYQEGADITIADAEGNIVATITQDQLAEGVILNPEDEWADPIGFKATLAEAITAPGTYTMTIPEQAFYLGESYENSPEVKFTWTIEEVSEIDALAAAGTVVYIVNTNNQILYGPDAQNTGLATNVDEAKAGAVSAFKIEKADNGYLLRCVTPAGGDYSLWGANPCYFNAQPNVGGVTFNLGKDQDVANGSTFNIVYSEENGGYTIQCVANNGYVAGTTTTEEATMYFNFLTEEEAIATCLNAIRTNTKDGKYLKNGKIVIVKSGKTYNTVGNRVK